MFMFGENVYTVRAYVLTNDCHRNVCVLFLSLSALNVTIMTSGDQWTHEHFWDIYLSVVSWRFCLVITR